jgi:type II secretory pathway pseudopilin PulG
MNKSFTLIEILIVVGVLAVLVGLSVPIFGLFQKTSALNSSTEEIVGFLRLAQNKTLALERGGQWGIYFSTSTSPQKYILFKGQSFALRDSSLDQAESLSKNIEIYQIDLAGKSEVVFSKISGQAVPAGNIYLRLKDDQSKFVTIFIDGSGKVDFTDSALPSDTNRIKDSRHIHFDYSRIISTSMEKLTLIFSNSPSPDVSQDIIIADNLIDGQIFWEEEVIVGGEAQNIKIQTHRLNNLDTQFSLHRDKRYNTKAFRVTISGDMSGDLMQYQANGQTAAGSSIYVTDPDWQ